MQGHRGVRRRSSAFIDATVSRTTRPAGRLAARALSTVCARRRYHRARYV